MNRNCLFYGIIAYITCFYTLYGVPEKSNISVIQAPEKRGSYWEYLKANYSQAQGDAEKAMNHYEELLKLNPSPHVYRGYLPFLFELGQFEAITKLYEQRGDIQEALQNTLEPQLIIAQSYLNLDKDVKAEKIFERLATQYPDNEQVAYFTCLGLLKQDQLDAAMEAIDKALNNFALKQRHFLFYLLKSKILVQQNKLHEALAVIEKSIEQFPKFDRALLFKAVLQEQMGNINESIKGYQKFLDVVGRDLTVERQLTQLLFSAQRYDEALKYLKRLKGHSPEYFFELGLVEFKTGSLTTAMKHLDEAIKLDPTFKKACILKIETLLQMNKPSEALSFVGNWVTKNPDDPSALHTLMLLRKTGIQTDALIKTLLQIERKQAHINVFAALADLYMETKNFKAATHYYTKMLNITRDSIIKSKVLFHLGYLYFVTQQHAMLEKRLKEALTYKPVYPSAYNLLAYHYAQQNKNLPEALEMIEKALTANPQCYYYLDTKGYILLKQGHKEQALALFKKAAAIDPEDPVIKNHIKLAMEGT